MIRTRLLERASQAQPDVVLLTAPAGYGKTTFVAQLALCDAVAIDLRGADSYGAFALVVLNAVSVAIPNTAATIAQLSLALPADASRETATAIALEAWRMLADDAAIVFENAEVAAVSPECCAMLARLLTERRERRILVCSRVALPLRFHRYAAIDRILRLGAHDLRFDDAEMTSIIAGDLPSDAAAIRAVAAITQGWPIATAALAELVRRGDADVPQRLASRGREDLYEYVTDEVLQTLSPDEVDAAIFCAALPNAPIDVATAILGPNGASTLRNLASNSLF